MKTKHVLVNDIEMTYFCFGRGERTLVILPGIGVKSVSSSAKAVEAAYNCFADDYTVYVFDYPCNPPQQYSIRAIASDVAAVMCELGLADADVFGASLGGMITQYLAADAPELVHSIVLGSTGAHSNEVIAAVCERWIRFARERDITGLTCDFVDRLYSENTVRQYRDFLIHMNDQADDAELDRFIILAECIFDFDARDALKKVRCPALVIGVENDAAFGNNASHELAQLLGAELYIYGTEYGHCVFDEAPDYKERLMEFYQKHW